MSSRRRRLLRASLAASAAVVLATLARADAPSDQYGTFNLSTPVIADAKTGLSWQRYPPTAGVSFQGAADYCATLSLYIFASGWRVPSYKELLTLVDEAPHVEYEGTTVVEKFIDANAFPGAAVTTSPYWTSSAYPAQAGSAYVVDFHTGVPQAQDTGFSAYVRCVH
jgi:hypothetical protein